ncbi:mucin-2-like [Lytechinus pictus]|uniref:mucin-2-like n=1 Tax=Lytechinus pictus TaxID=7653 RepID=UPI0030B9AE43
MPSSLVKITDLELRCTSILSSNDHLHALCLHHGIIPPDSIPLGSAGGPPKASSTLNRGTSQVLKEPVTTSNQFSVLCDLPEATKGCPSTSFPVTSHRLKKQKPPTASNSPRSKRSHATYAPRIDAVYSPTLRKSPQRRPPPPLREQRQTPLPTGNPRGSPPPVSNVRASVDPPLPTFRANNITPRRRSSPHPVSPNYVAPVYAPPSDLPPCPPFPRHMNSFTSSPVSTLPGHTSHGQNDAAGSSYRASLADHSLHTAFDVSPNNASFIPPPTLNRSVRMNIGKSSPTLALPVSEGSSLPSHSPLLASVKSAISSDGKEQHSPSHPSQGSASGISLPSPCPSTASTSVPISAPTTAVAINLSGSHSPPPTGPQKQTSDTLISSPNSRNSLNSSHHPPSGKPNPLTNAAQVKAANVTKHSNHYRHLHSTSISQAPSTHQHVPPAEFVSQDSLLDFRQGRASLRTHIQLMETVYYAAAHALNNLTIPYVYHDKVMISQLHMIHHQILGATQASLNLLPAHPQSN